MSETYVAISNNDIVGFISLMDEYLGAIFIKTSTQRKGIGTLLIDYVKRIHNSLQLKVYIKNENTIKFYESN